METIPYDKRAGKLWFNGVAVDWKDAKIHVLNHGLHYASCVFEGERVYDGKIFKLSEHTERLFYSAKRMGIEVPYSISEINDACKKIVNIQNVKNGYVRPVIWRGSEMMAISAQKNKIPNPKLLPQHVFLFVVQRLPSSHSLSRPLVLHIHLLFFELK